MPAACIVWELVAQHARPVPCVCGSASPACVVVSFTSFHALAQPPLCLLLPLLCR